MVFENQSQDAIIIFTGKMARQLLRKGYTIIDVKPDKTNKIKSVFVFRCENNIERAIADIAYEDEMDLF